MIVTFKRFAKTIHFLLYVLFFLNSSAQYKAIEFSDIKNWPSLDNPTLSPDGHYAAYIIRANAGQTNRLCVRSSNKTETFDIENVPAYNFAMDSRHLVYTVEGKEILTIVDLKSSKTRKVDSVLSYHFIQDKPNDWLIIRKSGSSNKMIVFNLKTDKSFEYDSVSKIHLLVNGSQLVVEKKKQTSVALDYINLNDGMSRTLWTGKAINTFDFNQSLSKFYTSSQDLSGNKYVDVYTIKDLQINLLFRNRLDNLNLTIDRIKGLSSDARLLFFYARDSLEPAGYVKDTSYRGVRIWSYMDEQLKTIREQTSREVRNYLYAMSLPDGKINRIEQRNEKAIEIDAQRILIVKLGGDCHGSEINWNPACATKRYILSITDSKRTYIPEMDGLRDVFVSPGKKYLCYYDYRLEEYCIYNIATGIVYPITKEIKGATWSVHSNVKGVLRGVAGWLPDDKAVLIYDRFDIYLFDPARKKTGYCLTDSIGEKTKTVFALMFEEDHRLIDQSFKNGNEILLTALNTVNKDNGFFKAKLSGDLQKLSMGPYIYDVSQVKAGTDFPSSIYSFKPLQSQFANVYMVRRMAATEFGNFYLTKDFAHFEKISDLHPEQGLNWYTTELHSWQSQDTDIIQGILYKPYDFDSTKKYPVIFHYYDRKSDGLNAYITPEPLYAGCSIDIPYYVSRGYLVALVDIHFKTGYTGQSALHSIVSAAKYFGKFVYVDSSRMGIEGFSFGGFLTYYLVTHTKIFAAASAGAGRTDLISSVGTLREKIYPDHELSQYRLGKMLWERPDLFIENSPVMVSNKVETPLLMMNGTRDGGVNIEQAIELFTALRRQGKKVWFLEYLEAGHGVNGEDQLDYCLRQQQFFDHYLKGKPMPEWMTKEN